MRRNEGVIMNEQMVDPNSIPPSVVTIASTDHGILYIEAHSLETFST